MTCTSETSFVAQSDRCGQTPDSVPAAMPSQGALAAELRRRVALRLGVAPAAIGWDRSLTALGVDSLSAVEIQQEIESDLGLHVSLTSLLDGADLRQLAAEALAGANPGIAPAVTPVERPPLIELRAAA